MAVIGPSEDLAAAVTCTGSDTVAPAAGEQTVTPVVLAEQLPGTVAEPTVMLTGVLNTAPLESQACTTTLCVPVATDRLTFRLAALVAYTEVLSI